MVQNILPKADDASIHIVHNAVSYTLVTGFPSTNIIFYSPLGSRRW
jgi:hypothetical protein